MAEPSGERVQEVVEAECPGCRGQGQFEHYGKMLDCGRCQGSGRVVYDLCPCCNSRLHERSLPKHEAALSGSSGVEQ